MRSVVSPFVMPKNRRNEEFARQREEKTGCLTGKIYATVLLIEWREIDVCKKASPSKIKVVLLIIDSQGHP
jgi:hypothetical protein